MVPLSVVLIMVLLYSMFKSMKDALLVMAGVLPAAMGGVWALKLTHTNFSISAAVGFISIFGVAVQNGVLLISYFNQMRASGATVREAVTRGAELRLRPVAMTSLTAILGLLPAALAESDRLPGSEAAGDRRRRRHLDRPPAGPLPDPRPLQLLPGAARPGARGAGAVRKPMTLTQSAAIRPVEAEPDPPERRRAGDAHREGCSWPSPSLLAIAAGLGYLAWRYPSEARGVWESVAGKDRTKQAPAAGRAAIADRTAMGRPHHAHRAKQTAMGLSTVKAVAQTEPIRLELLGTTEYITETLTKIRPMFKGRVDKVHVAVNQAVKKGDPLDRPLQQGPGRGEERLRDRADPVGLRQEPAARPASRSCSRRPISQQLFEETKNNEMKSRREYEVARDKLFVYGLTEAEVEQVETEVGVAEGPDDAPLARPTASSSSGTSFAGNLYDENDTLLVIAPLDRLWVWGNVFESDLDLVKLGQSWEIRFPFLEEKLQGKVEYISNRVDPNSHAVRVRTSIPNPEGRLKSDMLVRGMLEIPPAPGRTRHPQDRPDRGGRPLLRLRRGRPGSLDTFERRVVGVAQEKDDHAVIDSGLKEGEDVVSVGGLILAQIYEDLKTGQTGAPPESHGPESN